MVIDRRKNRLEIGKVSISSQNQGKYQSTSHAEVKVHLPVKSAINAVVGRERDVRSGPTEEWECFLCIG